MFTTGSGQLYVNPFSMFALKCFAGDWLIHTFAQPVSPGSERFSCHSVPCEIKNKINPILPTELDQMHGKIGRKVLLNRTSAQQVRSHFRKAEEWEKLSNPEGINQGQPKGWLSSRLLACVP